MSIWYVTAAVIAGISCIVAVVLRRRRGVRWTDMGLGSAAWAVAVGLKVPAAWLVFGLLAKRYGESLPLPVEMATQGLLTGVTECGITWLAVRATYLRRSGYERALGFGAGFGLFEAVAVGVMLVVGAAAEPLARGWGHENVVAAGIAVFERIVVLPVHALSCVLIWQSVRRRSAWPLGCAFMLKGGVDAIPAEGELPELVLNGIYGAAGLVSAVWLIWSDARERTRPWGAT